MAASARAIDRLRIAAIAALWWLVAAGQFQKYLGSSLALVVLPVVVLAAVAAIAFFSGSTTGTAQAQPHKGAPVVALAMGLAACAVIAIYVGFQALIANHTLGQNGAAVLDRAVAVLLDGHNPYARPLHADQPFLELPGSLILAAPFHWLGSAGWQNPFWAALFVCWLFAKTADARLAGLCTLALFLNPGILRDYISSSDYFVAAIAVLFAIELLIDAYKSRGPARIVLAILVCAVTFATHPVFWLLLPLVLRSVAAVAGRRAGLLFALGLIAAITALCLPFYFADPHRFGLVVLWTYTRSLPLFFWVFPICALIYGAPIRADLRERDADLIQIGVVFAIAVVPPLLIDAARAGFNDFTVLAAPALLFIIAGRQKSLPPRTNTNLAHMPARG